MFSGIVFKISAAYVLMSQFVIDFIFYFIFSHMSISVKKHILGLIDLPYYIFVS